MILIIYKMIKNQKFYKQLTLTFLPVHKKLSRTITILLISLHHLKLNKYPFLSKNFLSLGKKITKLMTSLNLLINMNMLLVDTIETLKKNGDIHFPFALISIPNVLLAPILNN
jgi:hypothetical protein